MIHWDADSVFGRSGRLSCFPAIAEPNGFGQRLNAYAAYIQRRTKCSAGPVRV